MALVLKAISIKLFNLLLVTVTFLLHMLDSCGMLEKKRKMMTVVVVIMIMRQSMNKNKELNTSQTSATDQPHTNCNLTAAKEPF